MNVIKIKYSCSGLDNAPRINVHLEPQNVTILGNRAFADGIS